MGRYSLVILASYIISFTALADQCRSQYYSEAQSLIEEAMTTFSLTGEMEPPRYREGTVTQKGQDFYRMEEGFLISESCWDNEFEKQLIMSKIRSMLNRARSCRTNLGASAIYNLFVVAAQGAPTITCDPERCSETAAACAWRETNAINFKRKRELLSEATWFHELLHIANVDNLPTHDHNDPENHPDDEVYFWERYCFNPAGLLDRETNNPGHCRRTLQDRVRETALPYTEREVDLVCDRVENYLEVKRPLYIQNVQRHLTPTVFSCRANQENCDEAPYFNGLVHQLGFDRIVLPTLRNPSGESLDRDLAFNRHQIQRFAERMSCTMNTSKDFTTNPTGLLTICFREAVSRVTNSESFISLPQSQKDRFESFTGRVQPVLDVIATRIGNVLGMNYSRGGDNNNILAEAIRGCDKPATRDTLTCHRFNTTIKRSMASMLAYW